LLLGILARPPWLAVTVTRPGPMRVAQSAPDSVDIRGRNATRAPLLLGVAVVLAVALALFTEPETTSASNVTGWLLAGAAGTLAIFFGWPRERRIELKRGEEVVRIDGTPEPMAPAEARLRLSSVKADAGAGPNDYSVVLERSTRAPVVLISDARPDKVLRDLELVRRVAPLSVSAGWGLSADSPWVEAGEGSDEHAANRRTDAAPAPASGRTTRSIAGTILVGSAGISAIIVVDVWHRISVGDTPSFLSLALPVLFITMLVAIGLGIWTSRTSFDLDTDFVFTRHVYGLAIERRSVARTSIRAAYLVSPDGTTPKHLLLDTDSGPLSFPCNAEDGARVLAAL
jgi:hypothetical protein